MSRHVNPETTHVPTQGKFEPEHELSGAMVGGAVVVVFAGVVVVDVVVDPVVVNSVVLIVVSCVVVAVVNSDVNVVVSEVVDSVEGAVVVAVVVDVDVTAEEKDDVDDAVVVVSCDDGQVVDGTGFQMQKQSSIPMVGS